MLYGIHGNACFSRLLLLQQARTHALSDSMQLSITESPNVFSQGATKPTTWRGHAKCGATTICSWKHHASASAVRHPHCLQPEMNQLRAHTCPAGSHMLAARDDFLACAHLPCRLPHAAARDDLLACAHLPCRLPHAACTSRPAHAPHSQTVCDRQSCTRCSDICDWPGIKPDGPAGGERISAHACSFCSGLHAPDPFQNAFQLMHVAFVLVCMHPIPSKTEQAAQGGRRGKGNNGSLGYAHAS